MARTDTQARRHIARDISYASSAETRGGRALIRVMENATGRLQLIKRADGYDKEVEAGRDFWDVMIDRYGLSLDVIGGALANIPKDGPLIVISNHPYGILDGLVLGHILSSTRGDFRILAHRVFRKAEDLNRIILPISFDGTKEALKVNIETRRIAHDYLKAGGAIGIFPGGTVSTSAKPFTRPMDPGWRSFTARLVAKSDATVLPIFFDGHNSRLFQIASHLHYTLRTALFINEFRKRVDEPVKVVIGEPLPASGIAAHKADARAMMDYLRGKTYELCPQPLKNFDYGFEFEDHHKH